jgi:predicted negative regulator of RcsB-dependent stress response
MKATFNYYPQQQTQTHKIKSLYRTLTGVAIVGVSLSVAAVSVWAVWLPSNSDSVQEEQYHPTSIPWLTSQASCERTGRSWHNGSCWDFEHHPQF